MKCFFVLVLLVSCSEIHGSSGDPNVDAGPSVKQGLASTGSTLIVYDKSDNRLGILAFSAIQPLNLSTSKMGFVTYGTTAFAVPDGMYMSMEAFPVYFESSNCTGQPYSDPAFLNITFSNQLIWTAFQIYKQTTITSNVTIHSKVVRDACVLQSPFSSVMTRLTTVSFEWNPMASMPWRIAIE